MPIQYFVSVSKICDYVFVFGFIDFNPGKSVCIAALFAFLVDVVVVILPPTSISILRVLSLALLAIAPLLMVHCLGWASLLAGVALWVNLGVLDVLVLNGTKGTKVPTNLTRCKDLARSYNTDCATYRFSTYVAEDI